MAEIEFSSSNEQLKSLVSREFPNYIPVPSLAECSTFNILFFCSPSSAYEPDKKSWSETIKKTFSWSNRSQSDLDSGCMGNFVSLGWLFDHREEDPKDREKKREDPVCIHEQVSGSQVMSADMKGEVLTFAGCGGSASFEKTKCLNLGRILKSSVSYHQIGYLLKRITPEYSPMLIKEAKRRHLYIVYDVLLAERLLIEEQQMDKIGGNASAAATKNFNTKGSGIWKRNKGSRLSRPKSMGSYPIAFKCGRVRYRKDKRHLELVGLKEFYEPFQVRRQNELSAQSRKYTPISEKVVIRR